MKRTALRPLGVILILAATWPPWRGEAATHPPAQPPAEQAVMAFLDQAVAWYRQQTALAQLATDTSDLVYVDPVRQQARQVVQQAFAFARASVTLQPEAAQDAPQGDGPGKGTNLVRALVAATATVEQTQAQVERLQQRLATAPPRQQKLQKQQIVELRSELQLAQARRDTLKIFADFMAQAGSGTGAAGLLGQIEELQRSVPEAAEGAGESATSRPPAPAAVHREAPAGVLGLAGDLFTLRRKLHALRDGVEHTARLRAAVDKLRAPLVADLRTTLQSGDQLSQAPDSTDAGVLQQRTRDIDQLTSHFKRVSGAVVPLGKQGVLLDALRGALAEWRSAVDAQYYAELRALILHLGLLAVGIALILAGSAFWRRATFRYVHDLRRRQQSLWLRRIVVAVAVVTMVAFSLSNELGSLATFAGFITAGLAIALQNVILSVVAYFFLVGKYGVRVGDRVQISGVTGDVMDIGLVRLHLLELGSDGLPTGRAVVFSNAVLFQPTANFFKQVPGSDFTWHQITLTLSPDTQYGHAERRLMEAVEKVFAQYRDRISRQHQQMAESISILTLQEPRPQSQLRLTAAGLEMAIRFPVPLESAAAVDDQVTRSLLDALDAPPRLKLVGSSAPAIQAVAEPAHG